MHPMPLTAGKPNLEQKFLTQIKIFSKTGDPMIREINII
ncbi:hypothetical protein FM107_14675 [Sphingobacterium sp. JB170]|nr:hypothetical protein FM107_14675 [Sphingobacterium sp. JB170]